MTRMLLNLAASLTTLLIASCSGSMASSTPDPQLDADGEVTYIGEAVSRSR